MVNDHPSPPEPEHRVVAFRRGKAPPPAPPASPSSSPVSDLRDYQRGGEDDDYRHRMLVNGAAFLFVVALIGAALWLADTIADMRRNQDCVLSGRRGCSPVEYSKDRF
jgi:hypothetical protein